MNTYAWELVLERSGKREICYVLAPDAQSVWEWLARDRQDTSVKIVSITRMAPIVADVMAKAREEKSQASGLQKVPKTPWLASDQYGMHFLLSAENEILWRCDFVPMPTLRDMATAANDSLSRNETKEEKP